MKEIVWKSAAVLAVAVLPAPARAQHNNNLPVVGINVEITGSYLLDALGESREEVQHSVARELESYFGEEHGAFDWQAEAEPSIGCDTWLTVVIESEPANPVGALPAVVIRYRLDVAGDPDHQFGELPLNSSLRNNGLHQAYSASDLPPYYDTEKLARRFCDTVRRHFSDDRSIGTDGETFRELFYTQFMSKKPLIHDVEIINKQIILPIEEDDLGAGNNSQFRVDIEPQTGAASSVGMKKQSYFKRNNARLVLCGIEQLLLEGEEAALDLPSVDRLRQIKDQAVAVDVIVVSYFPAVFVPTANGLRLD